MAASNSVNDVSGWLDQRLAVASPDHPTGSPPRGPDTFMRIEDFPFAERRRGRQLKDTAAELAVIGGVPDIADLVHCVQQRQGNRVLEIVSQP